MTCPRCRNLMESGPILGGLAWQCPTDGCGWFVAVVLDNKANDITVGNNVSARFALGGRLSRRPQIPNPASLATMASTEAR